MKLNKRYRAMIGILLVVACMVTLIGSRATIYGYTSKNGQVVVSGTTKVNVRVGPGTSYNRLTTSTGANIQLSNGSDIVVVGEAYASDGKKWYKIKFKYTDSATYTGYMHSDYVKIDDKTIEEDKDFEKYLTAQGFPESYKESLRKLHAKYPLWVFEADILDYTWKEVVDAESVIGRNLVSSTAISSWKSTSSAAFDYAANNWIGFDSNSWVAASREIIAYYLDPRNFLDETYIFQFENLSFDAEIHTEAALSKLLDGTFMELGTIEEGKTYGEAIMDAAKQSGVSPYHLAASIIQEQGKTGGSKSISGTVNGYESIYNYYNWGAYAAGGRDAITNGLIYASKAVDSDLRPWNTRYKSIVGGAIKKGIEYINIGQDTQYYIKFDFTGTPYTHQYMTNIQAAASEGRIASGAYTEEMKAGTSIVFRIPVFKDMPEAPVACPDGKGNPNNFLKALEIEGVDITPTFYFSTTAYSGIVENNVETIDISAIAIDKNATIEGIGSQKLVVGNNTITIKVTAENGKTRDYTIDIIREESKQPETVDKEITINSSKHLIKDSYIYGIEPDTKKEELLQAIDIEGATGKLLSHSQEDNVTVAGSGNILRITGSDGEKVKDYSILIYGDVNGDGSITIKDLLRMKKHILGDVELEEIYVKAGDVDKKDDGITIKDLLRLKKYILGDSVIDQQ